MSSDRLDETGAIVLLDFPGASNRHHLRDIDYESASFRVIDAFHDALATSTLGDVAEVAALNLQRYAGTSALVVASCAARSFVPAVLAALTNRANKISVVLFEPRQTRPEQLADAARALGSQYGLDADDIMSACREGPRGSGSSLTLAQLLGERLRELGLAPSGSDAPTEQVAQIVRYQVGWLDYLNHSLRHGAAPDPLPHLVIDNLQLRWRGADADGSPADRLIAAGDSNLGLLRQLVSTQDIRATVLQA